MEKPVEGCPRGECLLPKTNIRYAWQIAYVFLGLAVLFISEKDFTFFQTFLFVSPIVLDIFDTSFSHPLLNFFRIVFGLINIFVLLGCFLGMAGVLVDTGRTFAISSSFMYFAGLEIPKKTVGMVIATNLLVPAIFWAGAPCQRSQHIMKAVRRSTPSKRERSRT